MAHDELPPASEDPVPDSGRRRLTDFAVMGTAADALRKDTPAIPDSLPSSDSVLLRITQQARNKHEFLIRLLLANPDLYERLQAEAYAKVQERYREQLLTTSYEPTWLKPDARRVFYDVETYHLPNDAELDGMYPTGSTNYYTKQRIGTCVTISDDGKVECWDEQRVKGLREYLLGFDEIVSFNGLRFDNYILQGYSNSPAEHQAIVNRSMDLMLLLEIIEGQRRSLDHWSKKFLNRGKLDRGPKSKQVPETLRTGTREQIAWIWKYCYWDVLLLKDLYDAIPVNVANKEKFYDGLVQGVENDVRRMVAGLPSPTEDLGENESIEFWHPEMQKLLDLVKNEAMEHLEDVLKFITDAMKDFRPSGYRGHQMGARGAMRQELAKIVAALHAASTKSQDAPGLRRELVPDFHGLAGRFAAALEKNPRIAKAIHNFEKLSFVNASYIAGTSLRDVECEEIERGNAVCVKVGGQKYMLVGQVRKGLIDRYLKKAGTDVVKIYAFQSTPGSADEVCAATEKGIFKIWADNTVVEDGIVSLYSQGDGKAFAQRLESALPASLSEAARTYREKRIEQMLTQVRRQLDSVPTIHFPEGETGMPDWIRNALSRRAELAEKMQYLEALQEGKSGDALPPTPAEYRIGDASATLGDDVEF